MNETIALLKVALGAPSDEIAKSISLATGLQAYDLQAPAKNLYPVLTPIRNRIPRTGGGVGLATHWKQVSAIVGSGYNSMPWVPEGQRSAQMSYVTADKAATYRTIGEEDYVTYEAINAGKGFEDVKANMVLRLLQKTMLKEEDAILGGNASVALGVTPTPTVTAAATGGIIGAGTYNVIAVALTYEGFRNSTVANGVATSQSITGADGLTYTLNGGSANKSAAGSTGALTGTTNTISATVTPVAGAVAYAWFVGTAGNEVLTAITLINSVSLTTLAGAGTQNASAITADNSTNPNLAFDGMLSTINSGTGAYTKSLATGTAGSGTGLTSSGRGSIVEIDEMLYTMWNSYQVSPTVLFVNAQELQNITSKVLNDSSGPLVRYQTDGKNPLAIVASGKVEYYYNPFSVDGGYMIPIMLHPTLPPGTIMGWCENLPAQYQNNNVPQTVEVRTRADYYEIDWPIKTRKQEVGVYAEEVLATYAPFAMCSINNIANK